MMASPTTAIFLATAPTDLRKAYDGPAVASANLNPQHKEIIVVDQAAAGAGGGARGVAGGGAGLVPGDQAFKEELLAQRHEKGGITTVTCGSWRGPGCPIASARSERWCDFVWATPIGMHWQSYTARARHFSQVPESL